MFNSTNLQRQIKNDQQEEKWRLLHAKDFQSLMYLCFVFCRIIGVFPYKINALIFEVSKPRFVLSGFITCIFCIYGLILLCNSYRPVKVNMLFLPSLLSKSCLIMFGCFIMIVTFILSGPRMRLLQTIWKISSRLPPEFYRKLSKLIYIKDIINFFYIAGLMSIMGFSISINPLFLTHINLVISQMDMLYINCVCVLKACFKEISNNLIHMQELMANDEPHISRLIYHKQRNPFLIIELNALKKQHLIISNTVQDLNTIFSLQILATIVLTFTTLTFCSYYLILIWTSNVSIQYTTRFTYILILSHMVYVFIKVVLIAWACETGKNEAMKIGTSIHDAFNSTSDEQIKNELQLFSLQISHCNNTFSAKGFIIDAKLLVKIIGSITTYLLILFQFYSVSCK